MEPIKREILALKEQERQEMEQLWQKEKQKQVVCKSMQAFHNSIIMQETSGFYEFLWMQLRYMKKRWWCVQAGILLLLWCGIYQNSGGDLVYRSSGILIPLFVIAMIPELWKNLKNRSVEVESAAYYTLRQVYAARLVVFGMVDLLLLSLFLWGVTRAVPLNVRAVIVQFAIPFLITSCICLLTLSSKRWNSEYAALGFCLLFSAVWMGIMCKNTVYLSLSVPVWMGLLLVSVSFLVYSVRRVVCCGAEFREEKIIWN